MAANLGLFYAAPAKYSRNAADSFSDTPADDEAPRDTFKASSNLRGILAQHGGVLPPPLAAAFIKRAAAGQETLTIVALVQDHLLDMSQPEIRRIADRFADVAPLHKKWLEDLAQMPTYAASPPSSTHWGEVISKAWDAAPSASSPLPAQSLPGKRSLAQSVSREYSSSWFERFIQARTIAAQLAWHAALRPGCRLTIKSPVARAALEAELSNPGFVRSLYSLLVNSSQAVEHPQHLQDLPFEDLFSTTDNTRVALLGSIFSTHACHSLHAHIGELLARESRAVNVEIIADLMPYGRLLCLWDEGRPDWVDWLRDLEPLWRASARSIRKSFRSLAQERSDLSLASALALSAMQAVAETGTASWNVMLRWRNLPEDDLKCGIEAFLADFRLRQRLVKGECFKLPTTATLALESDPTMRLAWTLGHALHLPQDGLLRTFKERYDDIALSQPTNAAERALLFTCLEYFAQFPQKPECHQRLEKLLSQSGPDLELLVTRFPALGNALKESLPKNVSDSMQVQALTQALVLYRDKTIDFADSLVRSYLSEVRRAIGSPDCLTQVRDIFSRCSDASKHRLNQAILKEPTNLLASLLAETHRSSPRHKPALRTGLALFDTPVGSAEAACENFTRARGLGLSHVHAAHAAYFVAVVDADDPKLWHKALADIGEDATLIIVAAMGQELSWLQTICSKANRWGLFKNTSSEFLRLAPEVWAIASVTDDTCGKLTEEQAFGTRLVLGLLYRCPTLLHKLSSTRDIGTSSELPSLGNDADSGETWGDFVHWAGQDAGRVNIALVDATALTKQPIRQSDGAPLGSNTLLIDRESREFGNHDLQRETRFWGWARSLPLRGEVPRDEGLHLPPNAKFRDKEFAALQLTTPVNYGAPLAKVPTLAEFRRLSQFICYDMGLVHGHGIVPLKPRSSTDLTFSVTGLCSGQNFIHLSEAATIEAPTPAKRWSAFIHHTLRAWVEAAASCAKTNKADAKDLAHVLIQGLGMYMSGFVRGGGPNRVSEVDDDRAAHFIAGAVDWHEIATQLLRDDSRLDADTEMSLQYIEDLIVLMKIYE